MIAFLCPKCLTGYQVPDDRAGKTTRCPNCGEEMTVPKPPQQAKAGPTKTAKARRVPQEHGKDGEDGLNLTVLRYIIVGSIAAVLSVVLLVVAAIAFWPRPLPQNEAEMVSRLRRYLPAGYQAVEDLYWRPDIRVLSFEVKYPEGVYYVSRIESQQAIAFACRRGTP